MPEAREGKRGDSSGDQDVGAPVSPPSPAPADESVVYEVTSEDLINEIKETADRLARDHASRGDLKILSRTLKELRYAFKVFAPYRHRRKITLFGSARLAETTPVYQQAVEFGRELARRGWMVVTGAASGIMEAGHVGAGRELSIGVNILLPFEQEANPVIAGDHKLIHLKYFFTRKLLLVKETHAVALFPGGFGTLDEGFEVLTLVQTGKREMMPVVLVDEPGGDYWRSWEQTIRRLLVDRGMISPHDLSLFKITDRVEEAVEEIVGFYRVYHSMRFVDEELVLRLHRPLPEPLLERLNGEFADILAGGQIRQTSALPAEAGDTHLAGMPRLTLHFDRRSLGRLRQLIDVINRETP